MTRGAFPEGHYRAINPGERQAAAVTPGHSDAGAGCLIRHGKTRVAVAKIGCRRAPAHRRGERVRRMAATSGMPGVVHPPHNMLLWSRGWLS